MKITRNQRRRDFGNYRKARVVRNWRERTYMWRKNTNSPFWKNRFRKNLVFSLTRNDGFDSTFTQDSNYTEKMSEHLKCLNTNKYFYYFFAFIPYNSKVQAEEKQRGKNPTLLIEVFFPIFLKLFFVITKSFASSLLLSFYKFMSTRSSIT